MPLTPSAAKGSVGIMLENIPGMQPLLPPTPIAATITGITAPSGSTGMKFYIRVYGYTASGSLTVTGVGSPASTETVNIAAPSPQQLQSSLLGSADYGTVNAYTAITNITTTGLTGGMIVVFGIPAAKFNIPVTKFASKRKGPQYSPNQYTGLMARDVKLINTHNDTTIDNFDSDFYGDLSLYWAYMLVGAPTWTTIPAVPTSLLAITALTTASVALTTQPTAPSMKLIIAATGYVATPVTLTITGTVYGISGVTETITINANGTYYSANKYSAVASIAASITTSGISIAVTGIFGWRGVATSESSRYTAAVEHFDGVGSWMHPFTCITDGEFDVTTSGVTLTAKGIAQDKLAIGDRTTNPLQVSRVTPVGFPTNDLPLAGWQTMVYLDDITGTIGQTVFLDAETEIKIGLKNGVEAHWTFNNVQTFTRAYPMKNECSIDVSYDIINLLQNEKFRQNLKQYLQVEILGEYIGTVAGVQYNRGWTWTLPFRYDGEYDQEGEPGKGSVTAKPKLKSEYDPAIGGSYQLVIITSQPPTYPN